VSIAPLPSRGGTRSAQVGESRRGQRLRRQTRSLAARRVGSASPTPNLYAAVFFAVFLARTLTDAFRLAFFDTGDVALFRSALIRAHRRLVASIIRRLPATLSLLFFFGAAGATDSFAGCPLILAHRRRWASFMRRRAAALNLRFRVGASWVLASRRRPSSICRISPS
jgi:hypothetical protein